MDSESSSKIRYPKDLSQDSLIKIQKDTLYVHSLIEAFKIQQSFFIWGFSTSLFFVLLKISSDFISLFSSVIKLIIDPTWILLFPILIYN